MRRGKRFVQIDVHHVKSHVSGTAYSENRVEVGTVVIHQTTAVVDELGDFRYSAFKNPQCVGIGHHHAGDVWSQQGLEVVNVYRPVGKALHLNDLQTTNGR